MTAGLDRYATPAEPRATGAHGGDVRNLSPCLRAAARELLLAVGASLLAGSGGIVALIIVRFGS